MAGKCQDCHERIDDDFYFVCVNCHRLFHDGCHRPRYTNNYAYAWCEDCHPPNSEGDECAECHSV